MSGVVIIPFNYEALPASEQSKIVPICIAKVDEHGDEIAWGWFQAVSEIQEPLRDLVRYIVGDVRRTSEVVDWAVHRLWAIHRDRFGRSPKAQVYAKSKWRAKDLRAGGEGERTRRHLTIALADLAEGMQATAMVDPTDYESAYQMELLLADMDTQFKARGLDDVSMMLKLVRDGNSWKQIGKRMDRNPDSAQRRFRRWRDRIAQCLADSQAPRRSLSKTS
jgi:DNA-directed RNA polymerase specialized sigma24 family protein